MVLSSKSSRKLIVPAYPTGASPAVLSTQSWTEAPDTYDAV
jgi:hypothetical protein